MIIDNEAHLIENQAIPVCFEHETLAEMMAFHYNVNKERRKADHPSGGRSDGIIASCIADYILFKQDRIVRDNARLTSSAQNRQRYDGFQYHYAEDNPNNNQESKGIIGKRRRK